VSKSLEISQDRIIKYFLKEKKSNVVILSDSLSLPRFDNDAIITYEQTYPYLLQEKIGADTKIINRGIRGITTNSLRDFQYLFDNLLIYSPKIVILQIGIVDCAPRLFSTNFRRFLRFVKNDKIRNFIIYPFKTYRRFFTKYFPIRLVNKNQFKSNLEYFLGKMRLENICVKVVNISNTNPTNDKRSFGFNKSVNEYNVILKDLAEKYDFDIIDINKFSQRDSIILDDGIHYTNQGSLLLADLLYESIK